MKLVLGLIFYVAFWGTLYSQSRYLESEMSPYKFGYRYIVQRDHDTINYFFFNSSKDSVKIRRELGNNTVLDFSIFSGGWGHLCVPQLVGKDWLIYTVNGNGVVIQRILHGSGRRDTVTTLNLSLDFCKIINGKIYSVQDYPYLVNPDSAIGSVHIYCHNLDGELVWTTSVARQYGNLGGATWTNRIDISDNGIVVLDPLTSVLTFVSLDGVTKHNWTVPMSTDTSWQEMSKIYLSQKPSNGEIKQYLGNMMTTWQSMYREHVEQVLFEDKNIVAVKTIGDESELLYYSLSGEVLYRKFLDSAATFLFLGKKVIISNNKYNQLVVRRNDSGLRYEKLELNSPLLTDSVNVVVMGKMFCEKCIDMSYQGKIVIPGKNSSIAEEIFIHEARKKYPKATISYSSSEGLRELSDNLINRIPLSEYLKL
jgi:hypothetical protein